MRRTFNWLIPRLDEAPSAEIVGKAAFGTLFGPLMYKRVCTADGGWGEPSIIPFGNISIPPQCSALHYAQQCFEGLKAYRGLKDKAVRLFRHELNAQRMGYSMQRLGMVPISEKDFSDAVITIVRNLEPWVPSGWGQSLYIRPFAVGINENLRVGPSDVVHFYVICCAVGNYYTEGIKPVSLFVEGAVRRAWPGGSGDVKLGANYAPTVGLQAQKAKEGFAQCLWLGEGDFVEEVGAMNFMVAIRRGSKTVLMTPPLRGTILPGVTRSSILELAASYDGVETEERPFTIHEVISAIEDNTVVEIFGCGTAAIVAPVKHLVFRGKSFDVPVRPNGLAWQLREDLLSIQHGTKSSPWVKTIC